ncbi:dihydrolipoamide acetyltransferase family protein [Paenibacillus turpanensis]|uniref:dihydrolipoamide acetyltransferase family protein n=1 Tax=Paenibacillus turpanensis TaxID=2689078 RepID=UPI001407E438|nr:dihydrolipoamide acetyltransferase family protein [Paenibacillus turpanensis]
MTAGQTVEVEVTIPHLAETLVSAVVGKWLKQPGDYIREYDVICELMTDKVNTEMPSPVEGTLVRLLVGEGQEAAVGQAICVIAVPAAQADGQPAGQPEATGASNGGFGAGQQPSVQVQVQPQGPMASRYSPAVLTLAQQHGIDLSQLQGTGLGGRITRKDVLAYVENGGASAALSARSAASTGNSASLAGQPAAAATPPAAPMRPAVSAAEPASERPSAQQVRSSGLHLSEEPRIPAIEVEGEGRGGRGEYFLDVTPIRNTIASRMRQSVTEIPHAWTMIEVDVTNLVTLRNKIKDDFKRQEGVNLTYLAFLLKAVVNAIKDYPIMNSIWAVDKIIVKRDINISLAVGTEDSVLTPVIKRADEKTIAGLARDIEELARKTRNGKLTPSDMTGGTFTVNNTGSFGSILSYPIINYPQAAILTFESIVKRPVVINDMIAVRSMANICLSLDHRILDGVICGRFLQRVKENLEAFGPDTKLY